VPDWFLQLLEGLGSAAGWTVAVALLLLVLAALVHGDLVPGWIHKREIARGDKLETRLDADTAKTEAAAAATGIARDAALAVVTEVRRIQLAARRGDGGPDESD